MSKNISEAMKQACSDAVTLTSEYLGNSDNIENIAAVAQELAKVFANGGKVVIFGNGGSACDALHFAEELTGRFRGHRKALPAIALAEGAHITCVANDYGFDDIFSRGVEAYGSSGDAVIGLSTSGNSANVIKALDTARTGKMKTIALIGKGGGKISGDCDYEFIVPGETSDRIQEIHMFILHTVIEGVERILFPENY